MAEGDPSVEPMRRHARKDGRKQLLVYVAPDIIKDVKKAAVDDDTTASAIAEQALLTWLQLRAHERSTKG